MPGITLFALLRSIGIGLRGLRMDGLPFMLVSTWFGSSKLAVAAWKLRSLTSGPPGFESAPVPVANFGMNFWTKSNPNFLVALVYSLIASNSSFLGLTSSIMSRSWSSCLLRCYLLFSSSNVLIMSRSFFVFLSCFTLFLRALKFDLFFIQR